MHSSLDRDAIRVRKNFVVSRGGFTLIELIIVVAVISILAAVAVPNLFSARSSANEVSAIATVRALYNAQAQFQGSAVMDADNDGVGEFGCFGELGGALPLDARGVGAPRRLEPPFVETSLSRVLAGGIVTKSGYAFQIWLPGLNGEGVTEGPGTVPQGLDADLGESYWACYAWPVTPGATGNRCFAVTQKGDLIQTNMTSVSYDSDNPPAWNAAFRAGSQTMRDQMAMSAQGLDTNLWVPVRSAR